ncbi:single-stranded DNA-binding protein [Streptomyces tubercidicus]|uniref:single-stranded DNA-binding protein n=1 Tax=Streptomyces tubercidicus TaxID=47759 RepID=UPI002E1445A5|nr:single-stranded DNA-binding protein [Streptomyces tubercidicus]
MAMGETPITVTGNLTSDPEVKFTASGAAMARFTVASTPRAYDRESGQYRDGTSMFMRCSAWRHLAEHVAESLTKGMRVIVSGRLRQLDWQTDQGENRSMLVMEVDDIGPSLTFATATVTKTAPRNSTGKPAGGGDAWNTDPAPAPGTGGGEAPPF